jgi:hypothetical protein
MCMGDVVTEREAELLLDAIAAAIEADKADSLAGSSTDDGED